MAGVTMPNGRRVYGNAARMWARGENNRRTTAANQARTTARRAQSALNRETTTGVRRTGGRVTERIGTRDLFTGRISNARNVAGYTRNEQLTMALERNLGDSWKEARRAIGRSTG